MDRTSTILSVIAVLIFIVGFMLAVLGVVLVYLGSTGRTKFTAFGQTFASSNVGISSIFLGTIMIVILINRTLDSIDKLDNRDFMTPTPLTGPPAIAATALPLTVTLAPPAQVSTSLPSTVTLALPTQLPTPTVASIEAPATIAATSPPPPAVLAPVGPSSIEADMGNQDSESSFALEGWANSEPDNLFTSPGGDKTKRFMTRNTDQFLTFEPVSPGWNYHLRVEAENGTCDDSFQVWLDDRRLVDYQAKNAGSTFFHTEQADIPGELILATSVRLTFRNTTRDACGSSPIYTVLLERTDASASAPRESSPGPGKPRAP